MKDNHKYKLHFKMDKKWKTETLHAGKNYIIKAHH